MLSHELQKTFDELERYKRWFEKAAEKLGPFGSAKEPSVDEWSLAQIVEHLQIPEGAILSGIQKVTEDPLPTRTLSGKFRKAMVRLVLRNGIKVPVPTERAFPKGDKTIIELFEKWDADRTKLRIALASLTDSQMKGIVFTHPIAGPLNALESLKTGEDHLRYHYVRARKIFSELRSVPL